MNISMNPSARYVTQQQIWSIQIGKPLTDRRIAQLKAQGHYGSPIKQFNITELKRKKRKQTIEEMFAKF